MKFVRVALSVPLSKLFDYVAASADAGDVGRRVVVPFGKKIAVGIIMALSDNTTLEREQLRKVISIERDGSPLPLDVLQLLKFCSDYYHHPIGEVVLNALPTRLRRRHALKTISAGAFRLTATGRSIVPGELPSRASCRRDLMKFLGDNPSGVDEKALFAIAPLSLIHI